MCLDVASISVWRVSWPAALSTRPTYIRIIWMGIKIRVTRASSSSMGVIVGWIECNNGCGNGFNSRMFCNGWFFCMSKEWSSLREIVPLGVRMEVWKVLKAAWRPFKVWTKISLSSRETDAITSLSTSALIREVYCLI